MVLGMVLASRALADEHYTVKQLLFLPPTYYVGDLVEIRVRITVADGLVPTEPVELPPPSWVHIRDVRVIPISGEYDIRISFSTYEPGPGVLPEIALGEVVLSDLRVDTASLIDEEGAKPEEVFDPELLPGSRLLLALTVGAMLLLPILAVVSTTWIRRLLARITSNRRERRPYKVLNRALAELQEAPSPVNNREFYIKLSDLFRDYLSRKLAVDYAPYTASELREVLHENFSHIASMTQIASNLARFDRVKFGGGKVSRERREKDIAAVLAAASGLEEFLRDPEREVADVVV